jgi:uncharacterized protein YggE
MLFDDQMPAVAKKVTQWLVVALVVVALVYLASLTRNSLKAHNYIGKSPEFQDRITVEGTGKAMAKPDVATISIGIVTDKASVAEAQTENTNKMNAVVKALKDQFKIVDADIATSQYTVNPRYDWSNNTQRIIGYSVSQSVTVKVRDFAKIGDVLATAGTFGANSVNGPQFTIDDPEVYKAQARAEAISQAKEKAKALSQEVGIKLGSIVSFSESNGSVLTPYPMMDRAEMAVGNAVDTKVAPTIEAGSQDIEVQVMLSYEVR